MTTTLLDEERLHSLQKHLQETAHLPGSIIEFGVYRGGSLKFIAEHETKKRIIGIDTFKGLPEKSEHDNYHKIGDFSDTSYEAVCFELRPFPNVEIFVGRFPEDFLKFNLVGCPASLIHIDVDMYESTRACLDFALRNLVPGGVILCDDYGAATTRGAMLAVNEFLGENAAQFLVGSRTKCQIGIKYLETLTLK